MTTIAGETASLIVTRVILDAEVGSAIREETMDLSSSLSSFVVDEALVGADPELRRVLVLLRSLDPPQGWLVSGAIY